MSSIRPKAVVGPLDGSETASLPMPPSWEEVMKMEPGQMCLGCNEKPATTANGTVPLCSTCAGQAKPRGVTVAPKPPKASDAPA